MSNAYVIGHITVKDEAAWAEYRLGVTPSLEPWGAKLLFRGALADVLAGDHRHTHTVVIRFPDLAAVRAWFASPAYQALIPVRERAAEVDLLVYEE